MNNYSEGILSNAILTCDDVYTKDDYERGFFTKIYPFTTENINGYINNFDLNNKTLLTVGSSGDQVINSTLYGCKEHTVVDICPYTKYYFYLKKAAITTLSYDEFVNFFCYCNYPKDDIKNRRAFNIDSYNKIKECLRMLDYESFLFWDELFSLYKPLKIRRKLFKDDEDRLMQLVKTNLYMSNEWYFNDTKKALRGVNPEFVIGDIFNTDIINKYDNIFLSNVGQFFEVDKYKELIDKLSNNLNVDGRMLVSYLYDINDKNVYEKSIYDLNYSKEVLKDYITSIEVFTGVRGILFKDENIMKDGAMIYKKTRH